MKQKFIPVKFNMACDGGKDIFDHYGFAFETPGWREFHAVAHMLADGYWTATHWESGRGCLPDKSHIRHMEDVPNALAGHLTTIGYDAVMKAIAPWCTIT